jgi:hypothetical protein
MSRTIIVNGEAMEDRRKVKNGEANRIVWWLLVTITGIALSGAWFWVSGITLRVSNVEAGQISSIERIARLEEGLKGLSKDIAKIDGKLEMTNEKLDRLLRRAP